MLDRGEHSEVYADVFEQTVASCLTEAIAFDFMSSFSSVLATSTVDTPVPF